MKDNYPVTADVFQQLENNRLVYLPILRIGGKVTTLEDEKTYISQSMALIVAKRAAKLVVKTGLAKRPPMQKRLDVRAMLTVMASDLTTIFCKWRDDDMREQPTENDFHKIKSMAIELGKIAERIGEEG